MTNGAGSITMIALHTYHRSSASYRVRIALGIKGLPWAPVYVHLLRGGGEQHRAAFRGLNPQGRVPVLLDGEVVLTQSLAIIEYLDETRPQPPLLPSDAAGRARVRSLAQLIACDIQPLQNLSVTRYLHHELACDEDRIRAWQVHWISNGLAALERRLATERGTGRFAHGDAPTLADCCLVPQCYAARRFGVDPSAYPTVAAIEARCLELPAFASAAPERQGDFE
jgi:maleylacetoacetate isomerase